MELIDTEPQHTQQITHNKKDKFCIHYKQDIQDINLQYKNKKLSKSLYNANLDEVLIKNLNPSWDIQSNSPDSENLETCAFMMNFNQNGDKLAYSTEQNKIIIWDTQQRKELNQIRGHHEIITNLEWFNNSGPNSQNKFITCSLDKSIKIWEDYKLKHTLTQHSDWLKCLAISKDNQKMLSGCVSSKIYLWDLNMLKPIDSLQINFKGQENLNNISTFNFQNYNNNILLCGTKDGGMRIYDTRSNNFNEQVQFKSHTHKLNTAQFTQNDQQILTSGRDNSIRIWDTRKLPSKQQQNNIIEGYIKQYNDHKCLSYNIGASFMQGEKYIITGTENNQIVIYETKTEEVINKISTQTKINHLVKPFPGKDNFSFALSGIQDYKIVIYEPLNKKEDINKNPNINVEREDQYLDFFEDLMTENSDLFLKLFYKHDISYSQSFNWQNVMGILQGNGEIDQESSELIQTPQVPQIPSTIIDPLQKEQKTCQKCNNAWKPPKSHHCSTCGGCQVGMDHHCPWIVNCVGFRNHRAFFLFTIYMTIGGIHYCYRSWNYFIYLYDQEEAYFSHHNIFMYIIWGFTSLFLFPGTVLLIGLSLFHSVMILTRLTTLDMMSGGSLSVPCLPDSPNQKSINPYDRGILSNISILFSGDLFFFWLPKETIGESDGIDLFRGPYCNLTDIRSVVGKQDQKDLNERIDVHKMINDLDILIEQEKEKYKDFNFQVNGKIYEFWKEFEVKKQQEFKDKEQNQERNQNFNHQYDSQNNKINQDQNIDINKENLEQKLNQQTNKDKLDDWKKDAELMEEDDDQF